MPDPFGKVRPGQEVTFDTTAWNAMLGAGKAFLRDQQNVGTVGERPTRSGDIIKVKNESGRALSRFSVLGLSAPIFLPTKEPSARLDAFKREVSFRGTVPDSAHVGKFCILLDPLDVGRIGRAFVSGVVQVEVDVTDATHTCCDISDDVTTNLVSMSEGGSAEILWFESQDEFEPGVQWAVVRIGTNCRICCHSSSSSSSSSTSGDCPNNCGHCLVTPAPCSILATVSRIQEIMPPHVPNAQCMNGSYTLNWQSGCSWYAPTGATDVGGCSGQLAHYPTNTTNAHLFFSGTDWIFELSDGFHFVEWNGGGDCVISRSFSPADVMSGCTQEPPPNGAEVNFPTGP